MPTQDNEARSDAQPLAPWVDTPTCKACGVVGMLAHVPGEDDGPVPLPDDIDEDPAEWAETAMHHSEELSALNDDDRPAWLWCPKCEKVLHAGVKAHAQAVKADLWADRPDREQAWTEELRRREVDRVAAEHAARQVSMFPDPEGASS